jgi:hypothetical protein
VLTYRILSQVTRHIVPHGVERPRLAPLTKPTLAFAPQAEIAKACEISGLYNVGDACGSHLMKLFGTLNVIFWDNH